MVFFHAGSSWFSGGFIGVDVFFVISGYLITSIILTDIEAGTFSFSRFYERRARRILPALLLVIVVCIPFAWVLLLPDQLGEFAGSLIAVVTFTSNVLFWQHSGYFATAAELVPLLHTWSLAVEEQFYVFFPLLLVFCSRRSADIRLRTVLISGALVSLLVAHLMTMFGASSAAFYLLPTRLWELFFGAIAAVHLLSRPGSPSNEVLSLAGLVMICGSFILFDRYTQHPGFYTLFPVIGTAMIIVFAGPGTTVNSILASRMSVGLGLISYSLYLWHQPLFAFARHWFIDEPAGAIMVMLSLVAVCLAGLSWRYVERPFRDGHTVSSRKAVTTLLTGSLMAACVGGFLVMHDGKAGRWYQDKEFLERDLLVKGLSRDRARIIRAGECHFNGRGKHRKIDDFIRSWACNPDDEADLRPSGIGVFGDSHSADKAMALRLNGIDAMQIGGAGCSLLPTAHGAGRCAKLLELFHDKAKQYKLSTVVLANYFSSRELSARILRDTLEYWAARYETIIVFSPMPSYRKWRKSYLRTGEPDFGADRSAHTQFFAVLKQLDIPANIQIIDTSSLFCSAWPDCDLSRSDQLPLTDSGHLSAYGAKLFGARWLSTTQVLQ